MPASPLTTPVTVFVSRRVKAGREAEYEAWLSRLIADSAAMPGFLGTDIHRPPPTGPREYTSVFRFDTIAHLRAFEESDLRAHALDAVQPFVEADATWRHLTGLEFWFAPPAGTPVPQPSRLRMALVMIVVVYGLVMVFGRVVTLVLTQTPQPLRLLITIVLEVFFLTYFLMPRLTRWLAPFIYPRTSRP